MYVSGKAISYKNNRSIHGHCSTTAPAEKNISKAQKITTLYLPSNLHKK